ncbi:MAG TPA: hypothetical protein VG759_02600 [Candidatus Angelobacter sp.]|nr:hypothetical protein [Candidatus Angelobacter sp.]
MKRSSPIGRVNLTPEEIRQLTQHVTLAADELWQKRQKPNSHRDPGLADWHGYFICESDQLPRANLFVTMKSGKEPLKEAFGSQLKKFYSIDPKILDQILRPTCIPRFREVRPGRLRKLDDPKQAGNLVLASDDLLGRGSIGTIGAFLKLDPPIDGDHDNWLLSCNHILVRKLKTLENNPHILGANDTCLSTRIKFGRKCDDHTLLDAAVAAVCGGRNCYHPCLELKHTSTKPLHTGDKVTKQGNGSGVTRGQVVCENARIAILSGLGLGEKFYENECVVGTLKDPCMEKFKYPLPGKFVKRGDSGALVVNDGGPAGILFAKTDKPPEKGDKRSEDDNDYQSIPELEGVELPFGLVTPFQVVLDALSRAIDCSGHHKLKFFLSKDCDKRLRRRKGNLKKKVTLKKKS